MCSPNLKCWSTKTKVSPSNELEPHQSQSQVDQEPVILVNDGCKHYGTNRNPLVVLDGLNMTVSKGTIYGLLGASGCGKTTLLNCILGQKKLNSGQIWVLGGTPNTKHSGSPGPRIGYMPQETALYGDFTINETFVYFGWIAGLTTEQIRDRSETLAKLLMLPNGNQIVKTLSGGEQRRVSFGCVLLHQPELLILDEPTVGLDPILRESIWKYLLYLTKETITTVILTTHYIEEVRQADMIGLMRRGELLAEDSPEKLIAQYEAQTLEEVFLQLSVLQNSVREQSTAIESRGNISLADRDQKCIASSASAIRIASHSTAKETTSNLSKLSETILSLKGNRLKALIWKNLLWWKRNIGTLTIALSLSVLLIMFACVCIGGDPRDLSIAVVNYETNNTASCGALTRSSTQISCNYFEYLKKHSLTLVYQASEESVKESVLNGDTYASIIVPHNYTDALRARIDDWKHLDPWDLQYSNIEVFRDVSNYHITNYLKVRFYDAFQKFLGDYLQVCDINPKALSVPIKWETPIYGPIYPNVTDAVFPGGLLAIIFMLAILLTSTAVLADRNESSLERTFATGVTITELLTAHIVLELIITVTQSILAVTTAFTMFDVTHNGSTVIVILLTALTGVSGICYGIFVSSFCDSLLTVNLLSIGSCLPTFLLCGALWPLEGMHYLLKPIASMLPLTQSTYSLRSVLQKNWNLSSQVVYTGFISTIIWTIIFLLLSIGILKFRKG